MRQSILAVFGCSLLSLTGCNEQQAPRPSAPGAEGPVVIHQWAEPGKMPIELIAHTIRQKRFDFKKMDLQPVLARLPQDDGMVMISSPRAVYSAGGNNEVTLEGPVKMIGSMNGQPVVGRAESASVRQRNRAIVFDQVELLWSGVMNNAPQAQAREGSVQFVGRVRGQSAPAALIAAVYALPQPISFPPLNTEMGFGEE